MSTAIEVDETLARTKKTETSDTNADAKPNDMIAKKVQQAIRALCKRNYKPPVIGRFIISSQADPTVGKLPHESPLLRNRIMLPFITPIVTNSLSKNKPLEKTEEKTEITFKFLPQKVSKKVEKHFDPVFKMHDKHSNPAKVPVFTFDFAVQCDFTTVIVKNLKSKVAKLEAEVVRLRNKNATLLNWYKNAQAKNENKSDGLKDAQLEVRETNNEIQTSKHSLEKSGN